MSGFISLERKLWDHPLFTPAPMTEREAWMWMIAQAAWSETRHRVGSELVVVPRGAFMATLREMQSAFMWGSDKRVRTFLKTLEKEGMIGRTTLGAKNAPKTQITIRNYEEYQSRGRTKDAPKTQDRTHHGRTTDAVKKQGNKGTRDSKESQDACAAKILSTLISQNVAMAFVAHRREMKKPITENSASAILKKLDGHHDPDAVITDSIANGWQGVFPEKIKPQSKFKAISGGRDERRYQGSESNREIANRFSRGEIKHDPYQ